MTIGDRHAHSPEHYRQAALERGLTLHQAEEICALAKEIDKIPDIGVRSEARKVLIIRMNMMILDAKTFFPGTD
jgi:hypothetical protein